MCVGGGGGGGGGGGEGGVRVRGERDGVGGGVKMVNGEIVWDVAKGCRVSRRGSVWKTAVRSLRLPLVLHSAPAGTCHTSAPWLCSC